MTGHWNHPSLGTPPKDISVVPSLPTINNRRRWRRGPLRRRYHACDTTCQDVQKTSNGTHKMQQEAGGVVNRAPLVKEEAAELHGTLHQKQSEVWQKRRTSISGAQQQVRIKVPNRATLFEIIILEHSGAVLKKYSIIQEVGIRVRHSFNCMYQFLISNTLFTLNLSKAKELSWYTF